MKVYAYRSRSNKHFMITAKTKASIRDVLESWFNTCGVDFSMLEEKFELITLEVEEEES